MLLYGAYLFYSAGNMILASIEFAMDIVIIVVATNKKINMLLRKMLIILIIYALSIMLLVYTGVYGAGMICVMFSLILAGLLLNHRQAYIFVTLNIVLFVILSILLAIDFFHGQPIELYGKIWYINVFTTQACGVILLLLINSVLEGLEKQNYIIRKSKNSVLRSEIKHRAMIENILDVILIVDDKGMIKYHSPNMEQRCGWNASDFIDQSFWSKLYGEDQKRTEGILSFILESDGRKMIFEARYPTKEGVVKNIEFTAVNMINDSNIQGVLINYHDITEHRVREDKITYLYERDNLTGLFNRQLMEQKILRIDQEENLPISVIYGDLNGLKIINDALGHSEGDKLLVCMAKVLRKSCSEDDLLFRVGGDEFLIIMPKSDNRSAREKIERIYEECERYNKTISDESHFLSISLGAATKEVPNEKFDQVIKMAEDGMYKRKILEEKSIHNSILLSMQKVLFEKSQETEEHAARLVRLSTKIGLVMGLSNIQLDDLELLAKLHDIGKIGIDKNILEKPTQLTEKEWEEMKRHSEIGYRIAKASQEIDTIADYIHCHHERWDGNGYPRQLKGENIPLLSRIISVVDSYDAMTENRVYRKAISKLDAIDELKRNSGTQFDPEVVKIFLEVIEIENIHNNEKIN